MAWFPFGMVQCMKVVRALFSYNTLLLSTACDAFSLIMLSLNTRLNSLVLGHPVAPFLINFNPSTLCIIVLFLFWPAELVFFFSKSGNKFWIPASLNSMVRVKVKLSLCTGWSYMGDGSILPLILHLSTKWVWVIIFAPWPLFH